MESAYEMNMRHAKEKDALADKQAKEGLELLWQEARDAQDELNQREPDDACDKYAAWIGLVAVIGAILCAVFGA